MLSKDKILNKLQNGDVVKSVSTIPNIYHYAIYIEINGEPCFMHNTPKYDISICSWKKFFSDRWYFGNFSSFLSGQSSQYIISIYNEIKHKKYDATSYNCEHFIEDITGQKIKFRQAEKIILIFGLMSFFSYICYKIVKKLK